ncbi:zinc finger and BTB domain-containing protein 24-like isoform X3 [Cimex lectularius]|uniref:Uncharacterized protein n=1 Tax=Cimex lectularius TaxID=79782 RepID=A0A8I6S6T8_CIMLE|nr:zinc finger and BTB domain-containing protein 24-like isoform X3 [Cimex lectularius]
MRWHDTKAADQEQIEGDISEMGSEHYCLRWNNHQSNLLGVFSQLLEAESLVDVTLASSEGHSLRAHKVVLSACSSYFRALFLDHPARHPIVILKDVCFSELRTLVEFMYRGEVSVETCRLSALLKTAESLKVKGLAEMTALKAGGDDSHGGGEGNDGGGSPQHPAVVAQPIPAPDLPPPPPPPPSMEQQEEVRSPQGTTRDDDDASSVHSAPSDMTPPAPASPHSSEPVPGPSGLPPVQDAPLSLKKEVEWDRTDDKSMGETSSDYKLPHDPENTEVGEGRALYSCMYCAAAFPHQSKLARHILSHSLETLKYREQMFHSQMPHYQPMPLVKSEPISPGALCKFCGKTFPDVGTLIGHLPVHTGDRPFKCEFCGKAFKLRHHMKDHCRVHTGERPFRCSLCGKTFSRSTILKAHEKTHYPKYVRRFLSSPSPEDERRQNEMPILPYDLSVESLCLPRPMMPCDIPSEPLYLPRTSPSP